MTSLPPLVLALILGALGGGAGGGAASLAFCSSASGSDHWACPTGPRGLLESIGEDVAFVSPQKPGHSAHPGSGSFSSISAGAIAGPLPSALSHQAPVQCVPARK